MSSKGFYIVTEEETVWIKKLLKNGFHPSHFLRNAGLSYNICHEKDYFEQFPSLPVTEQAQFADLVTQAAGPDIVFEAYFDCSKVSYWDLPQLNLTAIGGIAFLSLYGPEKNREGFQKVLDAWLRVNSLLADLYRGSCSSNPV